MTELPETNESSNTVGIANKAQSRTEEGPAPDGMGVQRKIIPSSSESIDPPSLTGKRDHVGEKVAGDSGAGGDGIAAMLHAFAAADAARTTAGADTSSTRNTHNKRGKREWLSYRGTRHSRVGEDYQVTSLPSVAKPDHARTTESNGKGK